MLRDKRLVPKRGPKIVILGAGFAGAYCARRLRRTLRGLDADVLVLDRNNYFVFHPLLVEAGVGAIEPRHVIVPIRHFLTRAARFRMAEVLGVDAERRVVRYRMAGDPDEREREAPYDHLVISMGSVTSLPPIPGLSDYGWTVKTLADAVALRDRAVQMLEMANVEEDPERRKALLGFVVAGGSYTGVEVAGEFNHFLRSCALRYRNLKPDDCKVTLVDRNPRVLPAAKESLSKYALEELRARGVDVRLKTSISEVRVDAAVLSDGEVVPARAVVWCAGIATNPRSKLFPFPKDEKGYLLAGRDMKARGCENVWAIGDCAINPAPNGAFYPPTAQSATRLGTRLADNIGRAIRGKPTKPCDFGELGALCALGGRRAVADMMGWRFSGFFAWFIWRGVYLMKMPTLSRKFRVALDWIADLCFTPDCVQLGVHREKRVKVEG